MPFPFDISATEGRARRKAVTDALHTLSIKASEHPGVLMDVSFDDKGDLDRESYLVEVKGQAMVVSEGQLSASAAPASTPATGAGPPTVAAPPASQNSAPARRRRSTATCWR